MPWRYTELANTLSGLYYRLTDIEALLIRAHFNLARFDLNGAANTVWVLALRKIDLLNKIPEIVAEALSDYPENPVLNDYRNEAPVVRKSVYAGDNFNWKDGVTHSQFEKITGTQNTLLPISFLETGLRRSMAVARVITPDGMGTGFLITSDNLFITNNHVIADRASAASTKVQFNYQKNEKGANAKYAEFDTDPSVFHTSPKDDWTIIKIKGDPVKKYGWLPLAPVEINKNEFVNIIQHPGGEHKQIGIYHNLVTFVDGRIIQYLTDTLPGSSGSPVLNTKWEVVGLHHSGGWLPEPGKGSPVLRNEGININLIIKALNKLKIKL
jgi:hypothetical protein